MKRRPAELRSTEIELRLAEAWQNRGRAERALEGYRRILVSDPDNPLAQLHLGDLLLQHNRLPEAIAVYTHALEHHPHEARFHKGLTNALVLQDGMDAAFARYELLRVDARAVEPGPQEVLCCSVVRNESLRLPFFLSYYRERGIAKFFVVDNGSTDGTAAYLLAQPDVYLWRSALSFKRAKFGAAWFELLLRRYGVNHWWVIVDADELLYYPGCETRTIPELCRDLQRDGKKALDAVLLDMYADRPVRETRYQAGEDFRAVCPYFDRRFFKHRQPGAGPYRNQVAFTGGMRSRIFGDFDPFYLSKVPLLKYDTGVILAGGQHWTSYPISEIADARGCLLHFKYFANFRAHVEQEIVRREHADGAFQYEQYAAALARDPALTLFDAEHSVRLTSSAQLVELGIMEASARDAPSTAPLFPRIRPIRAGTGRPFWSVMITTYDRTEYLEGALARVLAQAPGADDMQIMVLNDGAERGKQDRIGQIVEGVSGGRVEFHATPENVGQPQIFNVCIERARGEWIHVLHDDDWVDPGYYDSLRGGIEASPAVGAAWCRQWRHGRTGEVGSLSWLERESPGIVENWLERIAVDSRLQPSCIVVRRGVYESLGGYCAAAGSAFDWEMWKRIAARYAVWYEPQPLAHFREHDDALSHGLRRTGAQIADTRKAIEIARSYLPVERRDTLTRRAYRNYARRALGLAREYLRAGDAVAALANIREGLECSQGPEMRVELFALLTECDRAG
jgi:glycosyltransferase involved in cell wall biosynthesis